MFMCGSGCIRKTPHGQESNKITRIAPEDFAGATNLLMLNLGNNNIVSVAVEAFKHLASMQVLPQDFAPKNTDGTLFHDAVGIGKHRKAFHRVCRCLRSVDVHCA